MRGFSISWNQKPGSTYEFGFNAAGDAYDVLHVCARPAEPPNAGCSTQRLGRRSHRRGIGASRQTDFGSVLNLC